VRLSNQFINARRASHTGTAVYCLSTVFGDRPSTNALNARLLRIIQIEGI
jgi:hypothetical protein